MSNKQNSEIPKLQFFQFESAGNINLFRGNLSFPLNIVSLPSLNNLDLSINLLYQCESYNSVDKWNLENQTDIVGFGWSLPYSKIIIDPKFNGSLYDNTYYLVDNAQTQKLIPIPTSWSKGEIDIDSINLNVGKVSQSFINSLKAVNLKISEHSSIEKVSAEDVWILTDRINEISYMIKKKDNFLSIETGGQSFELENYKFWQITYYSEYEKWVVVKEDGSQHTFGGSGNAIRENQNSNVIQWGIRWNNWIGESTNAENQQQYVTAWNISKVENIFGNYQIYNYQITGQEVGDGELKYTKECHVLEVQNDLGWSCIYSYKPMTYDNSSLDAPKEYIDPSKEPTTLPNTISNANQSRYITMYLDKLSIVSPSGIQPMYVQFEYYELQNLTQQNSTTNLGLLTYGGCYKRYLKSITQYCEDGESKPGLVFFYNFTTDQNQNRGSLCKILYPSGGVDIFTYEEIQIDGDQNTATTGRNITIPSPFNYSSGSVIPSAPRVWYGQDYIVCAWYYDNVLKINIYTWVGRWYKNYDDWLAFSGNLDLDDLQIVTNLDSFILSFERNNVNNLYLFNRQTLANASWVMRSSGTNEPDKSYESYNVHFSAGNNFFIVYDQDNKIIDRYTWNRIKADWQIEDITDQSNLCDYICSNFKYYITANDNYYVIMCYNTNNSKFSIFYTDWVVDIENDNNIKWTLGSTYTTNDISIPTRNGFSYFNFAAGNSFAAITYITGYHGSGDQFDYFDYEMQVLSWDEKFCNLKIETIQGIDSNFKNNPTFYYITAAILNSIAPSIIRNSLVASGPNYFYYDGANWNAGNVGIKWNSTFTDPTTQYYWYTYTTDSILNVENTDSGVFAQLTYTDMNNSSFGWKSSVLLDTDITSNSARARQAYPTIMSTFFTSSYQFDNESPIEYPVFNRYVNTNWDDLINYSLCNLYNIDPDVNQETGLTIDTTTIVNQAPLFITYMLVNSENVPQKTKVIFFKNGDIVRDNSGQPIIETLMENNVDQQIVTLLDSSFHYRTSYNGMPSATFAGLVTFPAGQSINKSNITEITLHRYSNGSMNNPIKAFVVSSVVHNTGYQEISKCYKYEEATAAEASTENIIKFQKVTEYAGCIKPEDQKDGYTISYFYNGTPENESLSEHVTKTLNINLKNSSDSNYYSMLDGVLIAKEIYDVKGNLVASSVNKWNVATQISTDPAGQNLRNLYGGIAQALSMSSMLDGVVTTSQTTYSSASGNPSASSSSYYGSAGELITRQNTFNYAYEHYEGMWQANILNAAAHAQVQTKSAPESNFNIQSINVQTYKQWVYPDNCYWGTFEKYTATSADAPAFTWWDGSSPTAGWLRTNSITSRDDQGNITESSDVENTKSTVIYDDTKKFAIASFVNATSTDNAISYDSFEDYQQSNWKFSFASGSNIISTDSFTGRSCFNITTTGNLSKTIKLNDLTRSYVLACWIKTSQEATTSQITVTFEISNLSTQQIITKAINLTDGQWKYYQWVVDLNTIVSMGAPIQISINVTIADNKQYVRVDDIFFMPLDSVFSASVYNDKKMCLTAVIAPNGICNRSFYNYFYSKIGSIGSYENPLGFATSFLTRQTTNMDDGSTPFPTNNPNSAITIGAQNNGFYDEFKEDALTNYSFINSSADNWQINNNTLSLLSTSTAQLGAQVRRNNFHIDSFAAYILVNSESNNLISIGTGQIYILWNQTKWQLCTLINNELSVIQETTSMGFQKEWILTVFDGRLMFFANGILIFNYQSSNLERNFLDLGMKLPGGFSQLIVAETIQLGISFQDGQGNSLQSIQMESGNSVILGSTLYDYLGRKAINLKSARVTTTQVTNPYSYYNDYITNSDPISGNIWNGYPIQGAASTYFPECDGYPFSRQIFENSPLSRVIQIGNPGIDFAITNSGNTHITTIQYGNNQNDPDFLYSLPIGQYFVTSTTDPDGNIQTSYVDIAKNLIGVIQSSSSSDFSIKYSLVYDESDRLTAIIPPNYYSTKNK